MNSADIEFALRDVIRLAKTHEEWDRQSPEPGLIMGIDDATVVFAGEGLRAFNRLVGLAAGHALEIGGPHPEVVKAWAAEACRRARTDMEAAVRAFMEELVAPPVEWRVAMPASDIRLPKGFSTLEVAGCEIRTGLPEEMTVDPSLASWRMEEFEAVLGGMVLVTAVAAKDKQSAEIVAIDRFEAARAILGAATASRQRGYPDALLVRTDGGWSTAGSDALLLPWPAMGDPSDARAWRPGWHELSEAAADPRGMPAWPRRVLQAARWSHRARQSWWASERIAASFAALESLALPEGTFGKARRLAARISERWTLPHHDKGSQQQWLQQLYHDERTSAVHTGKPVNRDLHAHHLETLALHVLRWAIWHLSPFHRAPNEPCEDIEEVFDDNVH